MIPIKLIIKGLYSYREAQEIDFTRLTEASIFGIFGKVGSGKSSILEAITFALYGDTERMNARDDRNYNMMNLRSDELLIDYVCLAGKEGHRYRFTVKGKRNSKKFEDVKTLERKSYQWMQELNDWAPIEVDNAAERIIGLSYENFKRTIIIPQGRFQEFVELPLSKRTQMMNEIFQLERYDLASKVKTLKERNEKTLENIAGKLTQLGQTTPQDLEAAEIELSNTKTIIKLNDKELSEKIEQEKQIETLRLRFETLEKTTERINTLSQQEPAYVQRAEHLRRYQEAVLKFKPLFDRQADTNKQQAEAQKQLNETTTKEQILRTSIEAESKALEALRPQYDKRETLKQEIEELGKIFKVKGLQAIHIDLEQKQQRGKAAEQSQKEKIQTLKNQRIDLEKALATLRNERIDLVRVSEVNAWFLERTTLLNEKESIRKEANGIKEEIERLALDKQGFIAKAVDTVVVSGDTDHGMTILLSVGEGLGVRLNQTKTHLLQQAELLDKDILHLSTQQALQGFADALQAGEPCPLCGSVHHPQVLSSTEDIGAAIRAIQERQKVFRNQAEDVEKIKNQIAEIDTKITFYESQKAAIKTKWTDNQYRTTEQETKFVWPEFSKDDAEGVQKAYEKAKEQELKLKELETNIQEKSNEIETLQKHLDDKINPALQKLNTDVAAKTAEIETYQQQIKQTLWAEFEDVLTEKIEATIQQRTTHYQQVIHNFERLTTEIQIKKDQQNLLLGEIVTLNNNIRQHNTTLQEITQTIQNQLLESQFNSEQDVKDVLSWALNIEIEQKIIQDFRLALNTLTQQFKALQEETKGLHYDVEIHQKLKAQITELSQIINELRKAEGSLITKVDQFKKDLTAQADLLNEKDKLETRGKDIDTLSKLFKGQGFVSYVSAMYLQNLCNQANVRFHKMTRQQLQLEIYEPRPAEYDFLVRDLLNEGKTRAVKTLSGGQKFQVALSLALALADNIHAQTQSSHNFFFLDEGFGSLDKDALIEVFETLKSLRRENRIVGVISHVEDLQQEIDRYIRVKNDELLGSVVEY